MSTPTVALFVPCLCQDVCPETALAAARALELAGFQVLAPEGQTCCGQPLYKQGAFDHTIQLAKHAIEVFEPLAPLPVVSPSASCTAMLRNYPKLFAQKKYGDDWCDRANALASRSYELCEFLDANVPADFCFPEYAGAVAYHESCQTRTLGVGAAVRNVLARVPGLQILDLDDPDACCGFGGAFSLQYPEVSHAMLEDKLFALDKAWSQADITGDKRMAVTAEIGCMINIRSALDACKPGARILHAAHFLAHSFEGGQ